jgi:beta-galactosidase
LAGIVKNLDTSRPVTSACNPPLVTNNIIKSGALDLIGHNYYQYTYEKFLTTYPGQKFIGSETTSALETRCSYDMPSDSIRRWPEYWDRPFTSGNADFSCSAYDNCSAPWGSTHEETWKIIKKYDYLSGMFIWTGFDYLGEPTPYPWPAKSSYFGIVDLAGFPKDVYYMYQSELVSKPMIHIFPHWNWTPGKIVDIWAYSNCQEVELFLNGKSLGTKRKSGDEIHLVWKVPFAPGTLKAIGRSNGRELVSQQVKTAGKPAKIILTADRNHITADGRDLSFITVQVTDKDSTVVPDAENLITFKLDGEGKVAGVDNGSPISHEPFKASYRKAFHGLCLLVVQTTNKKGTIDISASGDGLESGKISVSSE